MMRSDDHTWQKEPWELMKATEFYRQVAERLGTDVNRAKEVTLCALESLNHRLTQEVAEELAAQLPRDMEHGLQAAEYDASWDQQLFLSPIAYMVNSAATPTGGGAVRSDFLRHETVKQHVQAVFSTISEYVQPSTIKHVAASLPPGVDEWFITAADEVSKKGDVR